MLIGAHCIIYSTDADADRAVLSDVLKLPSVDVGGGWLIFGLPPAEVAVHPSDDSSEHELYLMVDDVERFVSEMEKKDIACDAISDQGWGRLTAMTLPGGGKLGVYQPRHASPKPYGAKAAAKAPAKKKAAKKPAAKKTPAKKPAKKKRR